MNTKLGRIRGALCGLAMSALVGCKSENLVCPTVATVGLSLTVLDAADRRNLEADARVVISSVEVNPRSLTGTPRDAVRITTVPGRYALAVTATAYRSVSDTVKLEQTGGTCPSIVPLSKEVLMTRVP